MHRLPKYIPDHCAITFVTRLYHVAAAEFAMLEEIVEEVVLQETPDNRLCPLVSKDGTLRAGPIYAAMMSLRNIHLAPSTNLFGSIVPHRVFASLLGCWFRGKSSAKPIWSSRKSLRIRNVRCVMLLRRALTTSSYTATSPNSFGQK